MGTTMNRISLLFISFATVSLAAQAEPERALGWSDLRVGRPQECANFLEIWGGETDCRKLTAAAKLMADRLQKCAPGDVALNGAMVSIAGFAHPLGFEFKGVREFLLIPLLRRDCRHPPPPLPDQVILVRFEPGIDISADPVRVTGRMRLESTATHLADTAYVLNASRIAPAFLPDVVD